MKEITFDDILTAGFGEIDSNIRVSFKKTIQREEYNPEVWEASTDLNFEEGMDGADRFMTIALLSAQQEAAMFIHLTQQGAVKAKEYADRKAYLTQSINQIAMKYESLTGRSVTEKYMARGVDDNGNQS